MGASVVLRRLCAGWADDEGGALASDASDARSPQPVSADLMEGSEAPGWLEGQLRAGALKDPRRAMDKALVCYGGDVSRLLDICRQRILLDGVAGVVGCLIAMNSSGAVQIVRVKSCMRPEAGPDSDDSAGFHVSGCSCEHREPTPVDTDTELK